MGRPTFIKFPERFFWGTATASHQVEGNNQLNDWWEWEQSPDRLRDRQGSGAACAWWEGKAEDDLSLAAQLGQNAHRLSLEWSRLEPAPGVYDATAFHRYRQLFLHMHALNIEPLVTIYHFTLPLWAAQSGGWTNPVMVERFRRFTEICAREFGNLVTLWCTINEPSVLAYIAYAGTLWPPGLGSIQAGRQALIHLILAHQVAYQTLRTMLPDAQVGLALNIPSMEPARPRSILDGLAAWGQDWVLNGVVLHALTTGELLPPLTLLPRATRLPGRSFDFLGLNYYGRYAIHFDLHAARMVFGRHVQKPTVCTESNDWGQISPAGLTKQLLRLSQYRVPLYVTENGVYDNEDTVRPQYLQDHVAAVHQAIERGADVRGYFHWSLLDNFEWAQGWSTHFGLIAVNRDTQERKVKKSGQVYAQICRDNGLAKANLGSR